MKVQWSGKHVELKHLCKHIENFFETKKFQILTEESSSKTSILATKKHNNTPLTIVVTVKGQPNDFVVDIECKSISGSLQIYGQFLTTMGLGPLLFKKMKLLELYKEVEKDFLVYLDKTVSDLACSAS